MGNGESSETRGSGGSLKRKAKYSFVQECNNHIEI